jgi:hypothetical protein
MVEQSPLANERVVDLSGCTVGEASAKLVELATAAGYSVAATAPGSYRLARTRRKMLVAKQVESVTVAITENRDGTRARIVGSLDATVIDHLISVRSVQAREVPPVAPSKSAAPPTVFMPTSSVDPIADPPSTPTATPVPPSAPLPSSGGLITTPSWARQPEPLDPPTVQQPPDPSPTTAVAPDVEEELDARTVARSSLRSEPSGPAIALPDGRVMPLASAIVIGRGPDAGRGPVGATPLAVADPSLSKTHAVVEADAGGVWVTDLHSTNGTAFEGDGATTRCEPGVRTPLPPGAVVRLGDVVVSMRGVA